MAWKVKEGASTNPPLTKELQEALRRDYPSIFNKIYEEL